MLDKGFENRREGIFVLSDKNPLANFSDSVCVWYLLCVSSAVCGVWCVVEIGFWKPFRFEKNKIYIYYVFVLPNNLLTKQPFRFEKNKIP